MNRDGFSLIECMVYTALVVLVMLCWFNGVTSFTRLCTTQAAQIHSLATVHCALDVCARDIRNAPQDPYAWLEHSDTLFIFALNTKECIGWEYQKNQLVRYYGDYNHATKRWAKKTKSLVLDSMQDGIFSFEYADQALVATTIKVMVNGKQFKRTAYTAR